MIYDFGPGNCGDCWDGRCTMNCSSRWQLEEGAMQRKTRSGYEVRLKAFIPFDPTDMFNDGVKSPKEVVDQLRAVLTEGGATDVDLKVKHRKRKAPAAQPDEDLAGSDMPQAAE